MSKTYPLIVLFASFIFSGPLSAESHLYTVSIRSIITDASGYNGCLVAVTPGPETVFSKCGAGLVTLGCDGMAGPSTSSAHLNLQSIQLAFAMNKKVHLRLYDSRPADNPYCLVDRVDVTQTKAD